MPLKRIDRAILSKTIVGREYTVSELSMQLERDHHEITGSMIRLSGKGFFTKEPCNGFLVYVRVREWGEAR